MEALAGPNGKETLSEWGVWLDKHWSWDWFVTLTHDNSEAALGRGTRSIVGWKASADRWDEWMQSVTDRSGLWEPRAAGSIPVDPWWVRGREPNPWRKGTHFHALIGGLGPEASRREAWAAWFGRGWGLARILPYDPNRGAAQYLAKYVVKDLGDIVFSANLASTKKREQ